MEIPNLIWMIQGYPYFRKPPYGFVLPYILSCVSQNPLLHHYLPCIAMTGSQLVLGKKKQKKTLSFKPKIIQITLVHYHETYINISSYQIPMKHIFPQNAWCHHVSFRFKMVNRIFRALQGPEIELLYHINPQNLATSLLGTSNNSVPEMAMARGFPCPRASPKKSSSYGVPHLDGNPHRCRLIYTMNQSLPPITKPPPNNKNYGPSPIWGGISWRIFDISTQN